VNIKICGVTRASDARLAAKMGAWAIGMIFVPDTPRYLSLARARRVRTAIPKGVLAIGVFRNPDRETLDTTIQELHLDAVQIYDGDPSVLRGLSIPVIPVIPAKMAALKKISLPTRKKLVLVEPPRADADRATKTESSLLTNPAAIQAIHQLKRKDLRVMIAGGLTPDNVSSAIAATKPWAVDVSSGIELRPGAKSRSLMGHFFQSALRAQRPK
jgi:phosphoribosylanthranilate isomerase